MHLSPLTPMPIASQVERNHEFDDLKVTSNSSAMEKFWMALQGHFSPTTINLFYTSQAWAESHAVGRVTCPITGQVSVDGNPHKKKDVHIKPGFFAPPNVRDPLTKGRDNLFQTMRSAMKYLADTQCDTATPGEKQKCLDDIAQFRRCGNPHTLR